MERTLHLVPHKDLAEEVVRQERAERTLGILSTITPNTELVAEKIRAASNDQLTAINNAVLQVRTANRSNDFETQVQAGVALFHALNFTFGS